MAQSGPRQWVQALVSSITILMAAILIRVIASWLGIGPIAAGIDPSWRSQTG